MSHCLKASLLVLLATVSVQAQPPHGLRVPDGFEVTEFADNSLANDIFCMTLDPCGRVVVSGRGYIRLLVDDNGDGRADRAIDFAGAPKDGAMGLFWEGNTLFCMGDGGLRCYRDAGGAGRKRPPELLYPFKTGGEHSAHAIRRGPDGWLYVLCGNNTSITRKHATLPTSPIREPIAGCVLRLSPDFKNGEIVADGFRNAYAFDFNSAGDLFTFDSDNERCVSLPWYEPTRCYHVVSGGHYGWQNPQHAQSWRMPPYFVDVVAPVATLGRGSPTGVVCYRHTRFPAKYHEGLFLCDWTFGRIYFLPLARRGSSYVARPEVFLQATGDNGFAPTAAAVHPLTGDLYVSIGGRGTRGAIYRIHYAKGKTAETVPSQATPRSLDWQTDAQEKWIKQATGDDRHQRRRALELILRHRQRFTVEQLGRAIRANSGQADRGLRKTTAALLSWRQAARLPAVQPASEPLAARADDPLSEITWGLSRPNFTVAHLLVDKRIAAETRLDAVRIVQLALGDVMAAKAKGTVWEGYSRRRSDIAMSAEARNAVRAAFPSGHADLDRELSRTLATIEDDDPAMLVKVAEKLTAKSDPLDDIHYLIVLARLRAPRTEAITKRVATALLALDAKNDRLHLNRDTNWPLRVAELHAELARKDSALNAVLLAHADFGRPDHVLFTRCLDFDRRRAAEIFLTKSDNDADFPWNAELIALLGALPQERVAPLLRRLWGEHGVDDAILTLLARQPRAEDRARFISGLGSARLDMMPRCLDALEKLPPSAAERKGERDEYLAVLLALRRLPDEKETKNVRDHLLAYLMRRSGQKLTTLPQWLQWYGRTYPERATRLNDADGVDVAAWNKRLTALDWKTGDAERGRAVFNKASCASCHSGAQALGPDLHGVTGRFSRADLFAAILQPSKDVSPRYRATQITTAAGKIYQGLIIYEAVDSVLLQTGPAATIRLTNPQIRERRVTNTSLMPAGLLDKLHDRDIADLYAYLQSLGGAAERPSAAPASAGKRRARRPPPPSLLAAEGMVRLIHSANVTGVAFAPDGKTLATTTMMGSLHLWEVATAKELWSVESAKAFRVAFSPDGRSLATGGWEGIVRIWNVADHDKRREIFLDKDLYTVNYSSDGKLLVGGGRSHLVSVCDVVSGKIVRRFNGKGRIQSVAFSPNGTMVACATTDDRVHVWSMVSGEEVHPFGDKQIRGSCVAFSPDGRIFAVGERDGTIICHEVASGKVLGRISVGARSFAFSPDSRTLAAGGSGPNVKVWELPSGRLLGEFDGHAGEVFAIRFSADGKSLAAGGRDKSAFVWDVARYIKIEKVSSPSLSAKDLERLWGDLANDDAATAYRALAALSAAPEQTVPFLAQQLRTATAFDEKRVKLLIEALDSDRFAVRQQAETDLGKMGWVVESALRRARQDGLSLEMRRRLTNLVQEIDKASPSAEWLRVARALAVLERIDTPAAGRILKMRTDGAPESRLTREAVGVLRRLAKQPIERSTESKSSQPKRSQK